MFAIFVFATNEQRSTAPQQNHRGALGTLTEIQENKKGCFTGDSLEAIAAAQGIKDSPKVVNDKAIAILQARKAIRKWTVGEFRALFTDVELKAFLDAAKHNADVDLMRFKLTTSDQISSDNPAVIGAFAALVSLGVLTDDRRKAILG